MALDMVDLVTDLFFLNSVIDNLGEALKAAFVDLGVNFRSPPAPRTIFETFPGLQMIGGQEQQLACPRTCTCHSACV